MFRIYGIVDNFEHSRWSIMAKLDK